MSISTESKAVPSAGAITISFGERFAASEQFDAIFKQGMGLVERTAGYLDGAGRREARQLRPPLSVLYASESMRLTTRLLELASWLMIRRAQKEGEISAQEARAQRARFLVTKAEYARKAGTVEETLLLLGEAVPPGCPVNPGTAYVAQTRPTPAASAPHPQSATPPNSNLWPR